MLGRECPVANYLIAIQRTNHYHDSLTKVQLQELRQMLRAKGTADLNDDQCYLQASFK